MSPGTLNDAANGAVADDAATEVAVNSSDLKGSGGLIHRDLVARAVICHLSRRRRWRTRSHPSVGGDWRSENLPEPGSWTAMVDMAGCEYRAASTYDTGSC